MRTGRNNTKSVSSSKSARLMSLDIFRGMTIAFMIIVNNPGSWSYIYPPLRHSAWSGCTPTDLVFPSFLFIVGVAMWYSLKKYNFEFSGGSVFRILKRVILIFGTGLLLNIYPYFAGRDYSSLRIMGVLQRIAIAYGLGAFIVLTVRKNYIWIVTLILLLGYWALMYFMGGADPYSLRENFATVVDKNLLGESHLYKGYGIPFDPEGLLSTIPAIGTVLLGFMTGNLISSNGKSWQTVGLLVFFGALLVVLGHFWDKAFPINKPLWSSSYVLYAGGIAMIILGFLFAVIDLWNLKGWTGFFNVFGMNAMFTYALSGIWVKTIIYKIHIGAGDEQMSFYNWIYQKVCCTVFNDPKMASLLFAIITVVFIWFFGYILYRKKIFIKF